jgi:hypothetical protein
VLTDTVNKTLTVGSPSDTTKKYVLHYLVNDDRILLKGVWMNDTIEVLMNKYDLNNYQLHKEKFTWIKE